MSPAATQDLLSRFPTLFIIYPHPVRGSFPGWLLYRKPFSCSVKESRLQSLLPGRPKPTVSLCSAILSISLCLLFNSTYLCLWHVHTRLFTATTLLCHWALSSFWWGHEKRGGAGSFQRPLCPLDSTVKVLMGASQVYGKDGSTFRKLKSEGRLYKNSNPPIAYRVSSSENLL